MPLPPDRQSETLCEVPPAAITDGRILYFERDRAQFGFLSHFHPSPFNLDGEDWPTVEHFYQAQKSLNPAYRAAVRAAETPGTAKRLAANPGQQGRAAKKSWFINAGESPRADWRDVKLDIMRRADFAKFSQNSNLGQKLIATGTAELIEDSPHEPFWGIGQDGAGANWAGRVLMEIRALLSKGGTPEALDKAAAKEAEA